MVTTNATTSVNINCFQIRNITEENLRGIKFHSKLSFENHVPSLCKKASQKLHAITQIVNYVSLSKRLTFMKTFPSMSVNMTSTLNRRHIVNVDSTLKFNVQR